MIAFILGGFIACGQNFVHVWVGSGKEDVYYLTLILMIPMAFANTLSGANSVLDGFMKRMGRSIILVATAILNIISSITMIKYIGYWGAAFGTALSVIIGQIVLLSFHYHNVFEFQLGHYALQVLKGILPSMLAAVVATLPLKYLPLGDLAQLICKALVYTMVYGTGIMLLKSNAAEKAIIQNMFAKLRR